MKLFRAAKDLVHAKLDAPEHAAGHDAHHGQQRGGGGRAGRFCPRADDPVLDHLLRDFRSPHLRKLFLAHKPEEYMEVLDLKLLAGTYNVAGKKPPPGLKLHEWLDQWKHCWPQQQQQGQQPSATGAGARGSTAEGPDIVAVGFQEVVPLSAGNVIAGPSAAGADAWDHALAATLNGDEWAAKNAGRMFGSSVASQAAYVNLGAQAAFAAYSMVAAQAATVVGAMDKMWAGSEGGNAGNGPEQQGAAADAAQHARRLAFVLSSPEDGEDVYVQVACKQLVGVYLSVWARKRVARAVRGVQAASAATGWGGYLGNKGAVAMRMRVHDAPLLLVCAHLASGDAEGDEARRNADVREIMRRCVFADPSAAADGSSQQQQAAQHSHGASGHWGRLASISEHDNVVWMGDLNYRLACSDEEARRCLRAGRLEALLQFDELSRERRAGRVFQGWAEGPVTFGPTYKYHLGCNVYSGDALPAGVAAVRAVDSSTSLADSEAAATEGADTANGGAAVGRESPSVEKQKRRTPAWCDRVLWLPGRQLHQLAYGRGELAVSDHRPVAAAFLLQAHRYQRDKVQQLAEEARRAADMSSNAARPRCTLEPRFIELGPLPFGHPVSTTLALRNVSSTPARWYFVAAPKPCEAVGGVMVWDDNQPLCPPWLLLSRTEGEVAPGEGAAISLTALITGGGSASPAAFLAAHPPPPPASPDALDAILILRLEDGADSFVSVTGTVLPSCFGTDLDRLLTLGASPVLPVEALGPEGQRLLQAALARPQQTQQRGGQRERGEQQQEGSGAPAAAVAAAGEGGAAPLAQRVGGLGLGTPGDGGAQRAVGASAAAAARDAAAGASSSALRRREGASGLEARVPKEVQRLVHFLEAPHALRTPGLFANSCQQCLDAYQGAGSSGTGQRAQQQVAQGSGSSSSSSSDSCSDSSSSARLQALLAATAPVRWALDTGLDLPRHVAPHQAAAALLLLLQQLPEPLMPPDVSAVLAHVVPPPPAAASLLSDTLSVAEWATLRMVLALARGALQREHALCNGLSVASLAGVLAEHCFGAESLAAPPSLVANRIAFMMSLLDPHDAAGQQQQQQQQQPAAGSGGGPEAAAAAAVRQRPVQPPQESLI